MTFLLFIFPFLLIMASIIICVREVCINYFNPIPKFDNKYEKPINEIDFVKCRRI